MKRNILDSTYLLTLTSLFCSLMYSETVLAQRTSGDHPGGRIVDTTNQGQVTVKILDQIEAECLFDVMKAFTDPALAPDFQLKEQQIMTLRRAGRINYWYNSYNVNDYSKEGRCIVSIEARFSDENGPRIQDGLKVGALFEPDCLKPELKNDKASQSFVTTFVGVPFLRYISTPEFKRNGFGAPVKTGEYIATQIAIVDGFLYPQPTEPTEIQGIVNEQVFFRYPKSQYVACLRDGLNKIGPQSSYR